MPAQRHDSIGAEPLITGLDFEALIGDKGFDNNWLRANLTERGAPAVIPSKADRAGRIPHDAGTYKWRHLVENFFCALKAFRRIATRATKRPMPVLPVSSIPSPHSSRTGNCKLALAEVVSVCLISGFISGSNQPDLSYWSIWTADRFVSLKTHFLVLRSHFRKASYR